LEFDRVKILNMKNSENEIENSILFWDILTKCKYNFWKFQPMACFINNIWIEVFLILIFITIAQFMAIIISENMKIYCEIYSFKQ